MLYRVSFRQRLRRTAVMLAAASVVCTAAAVLFGISPASAAAPYKPPNGVVDCLGPAYASSDACNRLNQAAACVTSDTKCFASEINALPPKTQTWWLDPWDGVLCAGADNACRSSIAAPDTTWVLDHQGASPAIPADEVPKPIPQSVGLPTPTFGSGVGRSPQACAGTVNDLSTCAIGKLAGGLEFYALAFAIGGMLVSTILWVVGAKGENPNQEYNGKRGLIVSVIAAFVVGAIPAVTIALNHDAKKADTSGVTTAQGTSP